MVVNVEKEISEISVQLHWFTTSQQEKSELEGLAEYDIMILEILNRHRQMSPDQLTEFFSYTSETAMSAALSRLCQGKELVSKSRDDQKHSTFIIELTDDGKMAIKKLYKERAEKFQILLKRSK